MSGSVFELVISCTEGYEVTPYLTEAIPALSARAFKVHKIDGISEVYFERLLRSDLRDHADMRSINIRRKALLIRRFTCARTYQVSLHQRYTWHI